MATQAQIEANRENSQHSTGPTSDTGKETSTKNAVRHGLSGHTFFLLEWENAEQFDRLQQALDEEDQPTTPTEQILIEKMAQHYWLSQRAQSLYMGMMNDCPLDLDAQRELAPYVRYHAHFERLFQRALKDLLTLRAEKRKAEIGFVSQKAREAQNERTQAVEIRRQSDETRKSEQHKLKMCILEAKLERELINKQALEPGATEPRGSESGQNSGSLHQIAA